MSEGKLDVEVDVVPQDEFRELGEAFNDMVRSLRASREALHHQVRENERLLVSLLPASGAALVREGTSGSAALVRRRHGRLRQPWRLRLAAA